MNPQVTRLKLTLWIAEKQMDPMYTRVTDNVFEHGSYFTGDFLVHRNIVDHRVNTASNTRSDITALLVHLTEDQIVNLKRKIASA